MRSHVGVASKMFRALSEEGINIQMITTSEIKTCVVIDEKYMELAVRALHKAFDLDGEPAELNTAPGAPLGRRQFKQWQARRPVRTCDARPAPPAPCTSRR